MRKCTEPDFKRISKRTTLATGLIIQCILTQYTKRIIDGIIQRYRNR